MEITVGDRKARAKAGETFYYPSDRKHYLKNVAKGGVSKVVVVRKELFQARPEQRKNIYQRGNRRRRQVV